MRKLLVLAVAILAAGSVFGAGLQKDSNIVFAIPGASAGPGLAPATTNNNDSCDISVTPAATLLLPYFEVDLGTAGTGRTTAFSVTNTSPLPQIAHVTIWTDWSFPVMDFNIYLTGYDVQPINLYDVLVRGFIGSPTAGSGPSYSASRPINADTGAALNPAGARPGTRNSNAGFVSTVATDCARTRIPGPLPSNLMVDVRLVLSRGVASGVGISCTNLSGSRQQQVGSDHGATTAVGYVTIDVAATCSTSLPIDAGYFGGLGGILYDNTLIGDYYDINQATGTGNYAGGNPMVHIRAIPEGGAATTVQATNLPFTFYDRYALGTTDRRQPLPSLFAARWLSGTSSAFETQYKIWREGFRATCPGPVTYDFNSDIGVTEIIRFDEHENAVAISPDIVVSPPPPGLPGFPETARIPVTDSRFPQITTTDGGGWMYLNLSNGGDASYTGAAGYGTTGVGAVPRAVSQNWVIISQFAEGRYGVDYDAAWLGNGCTAGHERVSATFPVGPATTTCTAFDAGGNPTACSRSTATP